VIELFVKGIELKCSDCYVCVHRCEQYQRVGNVKWRWTGEACMNISTDDACCIYSDSCV